MPEFRVGNSPNKFNAFGGVPETVLEALERLRIRTEILEADTLGLRIENKQLKAENAELRARLNQDSHNSSKPPSSDGPASPRPKSQRKPSGKKPGGQVGHQGETLKKVAQADRREDHYPQGSCCGTTPRKDQWILLATRQEKDLPKIEPQVTEHNFWAWKCARCGTIHRARIPDWLSQGIQYGPRLTAYVIYLSVFQHMPHERIRDLLRTVARVDLSTGTLQNMLHRISVRLTGFVEDLKSKIAAAKMVHFDETGIMVEAINNWIHSASTENEVCYAPHPLRGFQAMAEIEILPNFFGVGAHDCLAAYFRFDFKHTLCGGHLLRELTFLHEEMGLRWAAKIKRLLKWMKGKVDEGAPPGSPVFFRARKRWDQIISAGLSHTPRAHRRRGRRGRLYRGKARCLLERLRDHADEWLRFAFEAGVPFTNNLAERDLRMAKLKQKVSGGFRSFQGLVDFCRIRTYIGTMRKRGIAVMDALLAVAQGRPMPA